MYKRKPFEQCKIYFHGFSQTEQEEFDKYTVKLGGEVALEAAKASHILCHADASQLRVELDERVFPVTERDEPEYVQFILVDFFPRVGKDVGWLFSL